jgi:DDE family transposase
MSSNEGLYTSVFELLRQLHPKVHVKRIANWVWIVVGLIQTQSIHLSEIAGTLPGPAKAVARVARIRRWLDSAKVDVAAFYEPLIQQVLVAWQGRPVFVILDGCAVHHAALQFFRLSLSHCYRALPLAWLSVARQGLIQVEDCAAMLKRAKTLLSGTGPVTFLADRGFRDKDWAGKCLELGWDYEIRIANSTCVTFPDDHRVKVSDLAVPVGHARHSQHVRLTAEADWECNLSVTWTRATPKQPAQLCAIATNRRACHQTLSDFLKRMHIEESFRDDKSGSFDLNATHLSDADRLDHLLLAIAVAMLWIHERGERVIRSGRRADIDPAYKRQQSIFTIGWRALRRAADQGCCPKFALCITPFRLAPVWRKC